MTGKKEIMKLGLRGVDGGTMGENTLLKHTWGSLVKINVK